MSTPGGAGGEQRPGRVDGQVVGEQGRQVVLVGSPVHAQHPVGAPFRQFACGTDPDGGHPAAQPSGGAEEFGRHPFTVGLDQHDDLGAAR